MSGYRVALDPVVPLREQQGANPTLATSTNLIVAIEGLIPSGKMNDRRLSSATQPATPPVKAEIDPAEFSANSNTKPPVRNPAILSPAEKPNLPHPGLPPPSSRP